MALAAVLAKSPLQNISPTVVAGGAVAVAVLLAAALRPAIALAVLVAFPVIVEDAPSGYALPNVPSAYSSFGVPILRVTDLLVLVLAWPWLWT